jgi:hypothetical protein
MTGQDLASWYRLLGIILLQGLDDRFRLVQTIILLALKARDWPMDEDMLDSRAQPINPSTS